jgi:hypothetical protein
MRLLRTQMLIPLTASLTLVAIVATTMCIVIGGILATAAHGATIDGMFWMLIVRSAPSSSLTVDLTRDCRVWNGRRVSGLFHVRIGSS